MLRSLYVMLDYQIAATDGEVGRIQDFLFDDESWIVNYLVAETGRPLGKRKVLILPFAAGRPDWETRRLPVLLTCKQILFSPPLEPDMPISRRCEIGMKWPGSHLRSVREVLGYSIHCKDREVGSFEDFIVEDTLWGLHHAVVALRQPPFRSILLPPASIRSMSCRTNSAQVELSLGELKRCPDFDPSTPVNRDCKYRLYDYYGRPAHPTVAPSTTESRGAIESYLNRGQARGPMK